MKSLRHIDSDSEKQFLFQQIFPGSGSGRGGVHIFSVDIHWDMKKLEILRSGMAAVTRAVG